MGRVVQHVCKLLWVMVKFTNVTRLQMSGENSTEGSRVERHIVKAGEKSISWLPRRISTLPPVQRNSLFRESWHEQGIQIDVQYNR
jgi:hypothetical protein